MQCTGNVGDVTKIKNVSIIFSLTLRQRDLLERLDSVASDAIGVGCDREN